MQRNTYFIDEKVEKEKVDVKNLRRLAKYIIPYKKTFILISVMTILTSGITLIPTLILRYIVNTVIPDADTARLWLVIGIFIVLSVLQAALPYLYKKKLWTMGDRIVYDLRKEMFAKLQKLSFDYFDNIPAGKISVKLTDYAEDISEFFTAYLLNFVIAVVQIVIVTVCMMVISPILTAVIYSAIIPLTAAVFILKRALRRLYRSHRAKNSNRTAFVVESIQGEKVIKNYNRSAYNTEIYYNLQKDSADTWMKIVRRNALNTPIVEFFWNYGTIMIYLVSILLITNGIMNVDTGTVILFINYISYCAAPFTEISAILQGLSQVSANLERIFDLIDAPCAITEKPDAKRLENAKGEIEFRDVTFGYEEGINVLEHFSLKVKSGEMIALVGPTGAGKTTIINLITRFYDVNGGSVFVDGVDVRDYDLHSLRSEVGVLMQDPFIFKGTIMDNIRYGKPSATDEECIAAAKLIYADRVAARFEKGYYTEVEENGDGLSSGEKQLISFARIILRDPSVIILDEATSSIDSETERLIQQALELVLKGKTSFVVAHRLSTIRKADRILYIADKGIAEEGSHEQLMEKKGLYYKLNKPDMQKNKEAK